MAHIQDLPVVSGRENVLGLPRDNVLGWKVHSCPRCQNTSLSAEDQGCDPGTSASFFRSSSRSWLRLNKMESDCAPSWLPGKAELSHFCEER